MTARVKPAYVLRENAQRSRKYYCIHCGETTDDNKWKRNCPMRQRGKCVWRRRTL